MFGKIFSIIAGIILLISFTTPWYKFVGIADISPLDVFNTAIGREMTPENVYTIASMVGIAVLGGLMILTALIPKLYLSILKLIIAIPLCVIHIGFFASMLSKTTDVLEWARILETSPGFLMFCGAMVLYFFIVLFAIILSPLKGAEKLAGL